MLYPFWFRSRCFTHFDLDPDALPMFWFKILKLIQKRLLASNNNFILSTRRPKCVFWIFFFNSYCFFKLKIIKLKATFLNPHNIKFELSLRMSLRNWSLILLENINQDAMQCDGWVQQKAWGIKISWHGSFILSAKITK